MLPDEITAHVAAECKHLKVEHPDDSLESGLISSSHSSEDFAYSSSSATCLSAQSPSRLQSSDKNDTPLLTFRQVNNVCEKMLKEREGQLRSEYERVLVSKIAGTLYVLFSP